MEDSLAPVAGLVALAAVDSDPGDQQVVEQAARAEVPAVRLSDKHSSRRVKAVVDAAAVVVAPAAAVEVIRATRRSTRNT